MDFQGRTELARSLRRASPVPPCTRLTRAPKTSRLWAHGEPVVNGVPGTSPTHRCLQTELTKARAPASRLWGFHQASPARSSGLGHAGEAEESPSPEPLPPGELSLPESQISAPAFAPRGHQRHLQQRPRGAACPQRVICGRRGKSEEMGMMGKCIKNTSPLG